MADLLADCGDFLDRNRYIFAQNPCQPLDLHIGPARRECLLQGSLNACGLTNALACPRSIPKAKTAGQSKENLHSLAADGVEPMRSDRVFS